VSRLIEHGTETSNLYNAFEQAAAEALEAQRTEQGATAQAKITESVIAESESESGHQYLLRDYRAARAAESVLVVDPETAASGEGSYSDYRNYRQAEQRGERPQTYRDYMEERKSNG
jgi:hypothetical protein